MSLNRDSVDCRRRETPVGATLTNWYPNGEAALEKPGDFIWLVDEAGVRHLLIWIPGNENGSVAPIPVQHGGFAGHGQRTWGWDGNEDRPTLEPSIWRNQAHETEVDGVKVMKQLPNEWHGNLIAGRLVSG